MHVFFDQLFWGNTIRDWCIAAAIFLVTIIAVKFLKIKFVRQLTNWAGRTENSFDDFAVHLIDKSVLPLACIGGLYLSLSFLKLSAKADKALHISLLLLTAYFVLRMITSIAKQYIYSLIRTKENNENSDKQAKGLALILNIAIWVFGFIFTIDNLGYDVSTLVAGLGIGGIAIALAAQAILGDLFSYFVIFFDRPFEIGDFIVVEDKMGTVEYVGVKTTRIRTLGGEQLVCANTYLTNSRLHNYKRMENRRVVFKIGVVYQTAHEVLKSIPPMVKNVIESTEGTKFDRGNFSGFGDFSLNFEFVFYVLSPDYNVYMNTQESIFLKIVEEFGREQIAFAYPTQTLIIDGQTSMRTARE